MESARIADMQELCNLLIDNGYRLVKLALDCPYDKMNDGGEFPDAIQEDPILEKEMQQACRRAELIKLEQEVDNPKLVMALRKWRRAKAQSLNVPAFYVLANKTLLMIALAAPCSIEELLSVKGFGPVLAEKYGQELLDLIAGVMEVEEVDSPLIE